MPRPESVCEAFIFGAEADRDKLDEVTWLSKNELTVLAGRCWTIGGGNSDRETGQIEGRPVRYGTRFSLSQMSPRNPILPPFPPFPRNLQ